MSTMYQYFKGAHVRCIALLARARGKLAGNEWEAVFDAIAELSAALEKCMLIEETLIFSACDEVLGQACALTEQLRMEHQKLASLLHKVQASGQARERIAFLRDADLLGAFLQAHISKEEGAFYQVMEAVLAGRRGRIVGHLQMQALASIVPTGLPQK